MRAERPCLMTQQDPQTGNKQSYHLDSNVMHIASAKHLT